MKRIFRLVILVGVLWFSWQAYNRFDASKCHDLKNQVQKLTEEKVQLELKLSKK